MERKHYLIKRWCQNCDQSSIHTSQSLYNIKGSPVNIEYTCITCDDKSYAYRPSETKLHEGELQI